MGQGFALRGLSGESSHSYLVNMNISCSDLFQVKEAKAF